MTRTEVKDAHKTNYMKANARMDGMKSRQEAVSKNDKGVCWPVAQERGVRIVCLKIAAARQSVGSA